MLVGIIAKSAFPEFHHVFTQIDQDMKHGESPANEKVAERPDFLAVAKGAINI